jgi:hypothetical protein
VTATNYKDLLLFVSAVDKSITLYRVKQKEKETERLLEIEKEKEAELKRKLVNKSLSLPCHILESLSPLETVWIEKQKIKKELGSEFHASESQAIESFNEIYHQNHRIVDSEEEIEEEAVCALESREMIGLLSQRYPDGSSVLLWAAEEGLADLAGERRDVESIMSLCNSHTSSITFSPTLLPHLLFHSPSFLLPYLLCHPPSFLLPYLHLRHLFPSHHTPQHLLPLFKTGCCVSSRLLDP